MKYWKRRTKVRRFPVHRSGDAIAPALHRPNAVDGAAGHVEKLKVKEAVYKGRDPEPVVQPENGDVAIIADERRLNEKEGHRKPAAARHEPEVDGERAVIDGVPPDMAEFRARPVPDQREAPAKRQRDGRRQYLSRLRGMAERDDSCDGGAIKKDGY
ncbi:MAG: hypothetical protein ABL957_07150 [Parvularculaceae bacterium]